MPPPDPAYRIRTMTRADLDRALDWAAVEGWNPGLHDAACFHVADPDGFLVGSLGDEPIASISVVKYGATFAFLGLYIVRPEFRGHGYGYALWQEGLARLRGRNVGLDGVVAQQDIYRKSGFTLAYRNLRFAGRGGRIALADSRIVSLSMLPVETIIAYDRALFPDKRDAFVRCWMAPPQGAALGVVENDRLAGYGVVRACRTGYKIGPLFADTAGIAGDLYDALAARVARDSPLYLDVPEINAAAVALAEGRGMSMSFETARMYTSAPPALPLDRVFGVTTFELG